MLGLEIVVYRVTIKLLHNTERSACGINDIDVIATEATVKVLKAVL